LFVDVDWRPRCKNLALVNRIASRLTDVRVHVVGQEPRPLRGAHAHGLVRRTDLYALLGRTKVLACPALADLGSGDVFAASAMGCNVVASENCGDSDVCHEELRAPSCRTADFVDRIRRALTRRFDDARERSTSGYAELSETLSVM
jgi:hypothetical protein